MKLDGPFFSANVVVFSDFEDSTYSLEYEKLLSLVFKVLYIEMYNRGTIGGKRPARPGFCKIDCAGSGPLC